MIKNWVQSAENLKLYMYFKYIQKKCKNCHILPNLCCLLNSKNQQHIFVLDSFLDSKVQQKFMLSVIKVQHKHLLLVLRVQQTAYFEHNLISLTILLITTCKTCKFITSKHYIHIFSSYYKLKLFGVTVSLRI